MTGSDRPLAASEPSPGTGTRVTGVHCRTSATGARTSATGVDRIDGLDGLRAVAVLLVLAFHFGVGGLQGGFVGVDIFYVLSGYLITGLLLGEYARRDRIDLPDFWLRRARRLLPALLVVLVVVTLLVRFAEPAGLYPDFRMSALSALFYFSNWWQIAAAGNYFVATGAVSPLTHTWSLAVEEQFYLVWPLVVLAVLHLSRTLARGIRVLLALSVAGALASATEMALLYRPGVNITRLYFGTDTHAQSILIGAALACVLTMVQRHRGATGMAPVAHRALWRAVLTAAGLAGVAVVLLASWWFTGTAAATYRGGFLLVGGASAAVIAAAATVPGGPLAGLLGLRPLMWLGTVSYGVYLWHFPVAVVLDAARTGLAGPALLAVRVAATFALAAASYYLVERPVLEGTFWRSVRSALPAAALVAGTVAVVVAGTVAPAASALPRTGGTTRGLPAAAQASLVATHAFSTRPLRFLFVGDSLAMTMAVGLGTGSVPSYGVRVINKGEFGCDPDTSVAIYEGLHITPTSPCVDWQSLWTAELARYRPDVVGLLMARWSVCDRIVNGAIVHVGQPAWDAHLEAEYAQVVRLLASRGARVVVFTLPFFSPPNEQPDGALWPENQPARVVAFNRILTRVVAASHGAATLVDLNRLLDPAGQYAAQLDGRTVRWPDGIHITVAGGEWLQQSVLPVVAEDGLVVRASRAAS